MLLGLQHEVFQHIKRLLPLKCGSIMIVLENIFKIGLNQLKISERGKYIKSKKTNLRCIQGVFYLGYMRY